MEDLAESSDLIPFGEFGDHVLNILDFGLAEFWGDVTAETFQGTISMEGELSEGGVLEDLVGPGFFWLLGDVDVEGCAFIATEAHARDFDVGEDLVECFLGDGDVFDGGQRVHADILWHP